MRTSKEVQAKGKAMAMIATRHTGYVLVGPAADGSRYGTDFEDWLDWKKSIPDIILEVGLGALPVPED